MVKNTLSNTVNTEPLTYVLFIRLKTLLFINKDFTYMIEERFFCSHTLKK